jgi:hypothetical protein
MYAFIISTYILSIDARNCRQDLNAASWDELYQAVLDVASEILQEETNVDGIHKR